MEFARRRRRRRRNGIRTMTVLLMLGLAVYLITASAAGKWLSEKVMAPAFSALSELPLFSGGGLDSLEDEASEPSGDALSVSLSSDGGSVASTLDVPSISCFALQMGVFSSKDNADKLSEEMRGRGAGGYVYSDGSVYRVLASCYRSESEARTVKERLISEGTDCAIYAITAPAVTFGITADRQQTEQLREGFTALSQAQEALCGACIDFDSKGMTVSEGAALIRAIRDELSASCSPLLACRDASPAIESLAQCCEKCMSSLSLLAGNEDASTAAFSSGMKYALLELSSSYSDMLKSMAA